MFKVVEPPYAYFKIVSFNHGLHYLPEKFTKLYGNTAS